MTSRTGRRGPAVLALLLCVLSAAGAATIEGATARSLFGALALLSLVPYLSYRYGVHRLVGGSPREVENLLRGAHPEASNVREALSAGL